MGSRSKGPRESAAFSYHKTFKAGPWGESKPTRRVRRSKGDKFSVDLAKQFAVTAAERRAAARGRFVRGQDGKIQVVPRIAPTPRQVRQVRLHAAQPPGPSERVARLMRRVAANERDRGLSTTFRGLVEERALLSHREKGWQLRGRA